MAMLAWMAASGSIPSNALFNAHFQVNSVLEANNYDKLDFQAEVIEVAPEDSNILRLYGRTKNQNRETLKVVASFRYQKSDQNSARCDIYEVKVGNVVIFNGSLQP
jgi:hypothetical protein